MWHGIVAVSRTHGRRAIIRWRPSQKHRAAGHNRQHVISCRLRVLPTCPEWLRLSPGLPSPAEAGFWQLTLGSRYGSHQARSLETSWWIGNKNCQILRRTHSKLCYMWESYKNRMDAVKFHSSHSAGLSPTRPKLWEIILRSWQVELSKSETSQFRSDLVFYRKLCACNLLTRGLNVVLRYLKSSDLSVVEILWASNVPESSRCWQHHSDYFYYTVVSHFARHAMWFICIVILKIVNCECWNTQPFHHFQVGPDI